MSDDEIEKKFKLKSTLNCTNMVLFNQENKIQRYSSECEILEEFYRIRLEFYKKRKDHMLKVKNEKYEKLSNKFRFISEIIEGKMQIFKKSKD